MNQEIWFDEENEIIREEIMGSFVESDVAEYLARTREVLEGRMRHRVLVDFSRASRKLYDSRKVRNMLVAGTVNLGYADERVALLVTDPVIRMQARAMTLGAKSRGKEVEVEWFPEEAEAIAWLKA